MSTKPAPTVYPAELRRIHDGDTLVMLVWQRLNGDDVGVVTTLRLLGMNTPELRVRGQANPAGVASLAHLAELLGGARKLAVSTDWKDDKYGGRVLGDVLIDGVSVVARMIADGHALPWDGKGKKPMMPGWE